MAHRVGVFLAKIGVWFTTPDIVLHIEIEAEPSSCLKTENKQHMPLLWYRDKDPTFPDLFSHNPP